MKVAIISDIHGNMQALEAVLYDIESEKCDKIFCLGDLAMAGPEPVKTIEMIKKLYEEGRQQGTFLLIQGNTDEMIGNYNREIDAMVKNAFPIMGNALENDAKIITEELKDFLKTLPKHAETEIEGLKILLVHGSPRRNDENIMPNLPIEDVEAMLEGTNADLIFCGHTHIPCGYQTRKRQTLVNAGSVGRPFTPKPQSCYVLVEFEDGSGKESGGVKGKGTFDVMHKFVDYNNQKASEILSKREFEGAEKLAQILIKPEFRHM